MPGGWRAELRELFQNAYRAGARNVTLTQERNVLTFADKTFLDRKVYIAGEVRRPGIVRLKEGMTSLQAIFEAGGPLETANVEAVVLLRPLGENRFGHREINLTRILRNEEPKDVVLSQEDVIFVPRSGIAEVNLWMDQYVRKMIPWAGGGVGVRLETLPVQ